MVAEIRKLKDKPGKDLLLSGSAEVTGYQEMVSEFREAIRQTHKLREEGNR
ncbi:MAG: hypothetical protein PVSMB9_03520 [Candidatus Dormibacteria bacterium]